MSDKIFLPRTAKTQRGKRALENRGSKIIENVKKCLCFKGPNSSQVISTVLKDLYMLKKPDGKILTKKNMTRPFEDQSSVEFFSKQNDASLFAYGSHTKKRPHNLVLGRTFDHQVLDMVELQVDPATYKPMQSFDGKRKSVLRYGSKPMFAFVGEDFETKPDFALVKNLLLDFFRGSVLEQVNLAGLSRVIVCTAANDKIYFRHYGVMLRKSGTKFPKVELELGGPSLDFTVRRVKSAPADLQKQAMRAAKTGPTGAKKKNMEKGEMGDKMGRLHLEKQDLTAIELKKMKAFKKRKTGPNEAKNGDGTVEGEGEDQAEENGDEDQ